PSLPVGSSLCAGALFALAATGAFTPFRGPPGAASSSLRPGSVLMTTLRRDDPLTDAGSEMPPAVSVVVPVKNEAANIGPLVEEIATALTGRGSFEVLYVDD